MALTVTQYQSPSNVERTAEGEDRNSALRLMRTQHECLWVFRNLPSDCTLAADSFE